MTDPRRWPSLLLAAGILVGLGSLAAGREPGASAEPAPAAVVPGYVGSDACAACHEKEYREWKESLHSRMEQAATPETVRGGFTPEGVVLEADAPGRRLVMRRRGDAFFIEAPDADGRPQEWRVERTIGNRYKQRYLTSFPDGSLRTLPLQWLEQDQKFVEWHHLASGEPGTGQYWTDTAWQWQLKCAGCHTTGLDLGYDPEARTYRTRWQELAIGCEACHGPGEAHVQDPRQRGNILCPSDFPVARQIDACGKCHSRGTAGPEQGAPEGLPGRLAYPYNMLPGERLDDHYVQVTLEKNPKEFWPDGSSWNHHQQWTDYVQSGMFIHGKENAPSCTGCHEPHRAAALRAPVEDNRLCLRCHIELGEPAALASHTGHGSDPIGNPGARCVECHMPRIVSHAGSERLRSHTWWSPDPRRLAGDERTPNACLLCHTEKDRAWATEAAERIWPAKPGEGR